MFKKTAKKIPWKLVVILIVLSLGTIIIGIYSFIIVKKEYENNIHQELLTICDLKVNHIDSWRKEREKDGSMVYANPFVANYLQELTEGKTETMEDVSNWLASFMKANNYESIYLLDKYANVVMSLNENEMQPALGMHTKQLVHEAINEKKVILSDIYKSELNDHFSMSLVAPIISNEHNHKIALGALLLRVNVRDSLFPLIRSWPSPTDTAESYIIRKEGNEVVFLSELRKQTNSVHYLRLPLSMDNLPAAMAIKAQEGLVTGTDYRGMKVLAAIQQVPFTQWHLIVKIDENEVYYPIKERAIISVILIVVLVLLAGVSVVLFWRQQEIIDYREKFEAEEKHQALLKRFEYITMYANDIILLTDNSLKIIEANDRAVKTYGYAKKELMTLKIDELLASDSGPTVASLIRRVQVEDGLTYETIHSRKDGSTFPVEVSLRLIVVNEEPLYQSITRDITERKRFEKEMVRLERLNLIGQMAAGIGHEIRNPMTTVRGFLQLLEKYQELNKHKHYFSIMIDELDRVNLIITEFLSLAKNKSSNLEISNINDIINAILPLAQADAIKMGSYINIELETIPDLLLNEKEIRQILLNFIRNGIEAMPNGGIITIRTSLADGKLVLSVQDNGSGITAETLARIGTPFFTTKENGTGLGLAVCYSIASRHNATIKVDTTPTGTTFSVRFNADELSHGYSPLSCMARDTRSRASM